MAAARLWRAFAAQELRKIMKSQSTDAILSHLIAASLLVVSCSEVANAEIPKKSKEELHSTASHAFSGVVQRTYVRTEKRDRSEYTYGVAEIVVNRNDKGKDIVARDRVFVRYWSENPTDDGRVRAPGHYGHWDVPAERDIVEVYVTGDRTTGYNVLSPNGFLRVTKPKVEDAARKP